MSNNPWIEWSKQAPKESDLPIECADYGYPNPLTFATFAPVGIYDLWRPYVCDIPKAKEENSMKNISTLITMSDGQQHILPGEILHSATGVYKNSTLKGPQPDANGWWRIEDRKPECASKIKLIIEGRIEIGIVGFRSSLYLLGEHKERNISGITKWCPLDMTGPEEK